MRNPASYKEQELVEDTSHVLAQLDWDQDWTTAVAEAASILNEAISEEYGGVAEFHQRLTGYGFAESIAAGTAVRELLDGVPHDSKAETLATALDHASVKNEGVILAYRREYYELDELGWAEPNPATEKGLSNTAGELGYQGILLARETLKLSAYLCATPGEFGPKKGEHFLEATQAAYETTLCQNGETTEQALAGIDLAYRRLSYVARSHLESVLDHIPASYPAEQEISALMKNLDQTTFSNGAELLHLTAYALSETLENRWHRHRRRTGQISPAVPNGPRIRTSYPNKRRGQRIHDLPAPEPRANYRNDVIRRHRKHETNGIP